MNSFDRTMAYLDKLPPAVSGSGGHNATLRAACECYRFGLSAAEVWTAMGWFNAHRCDPAWKEHELRHKVEDAGRIVRDSGRHGARVERTTRRGQRTFAAPAARPNLSAAVVTPLPVCQRSEAEEEAWWARVFAERVMEDPCRLFETA